MLQINPMMSEPLILGSSWGFFYHSLFGGLGVPAAMARPAVALLAALALQWTGVDAYARLATAAAGTKRRG
jgi:hypothetical protein